MMMSIGLKYVEFIDTTNKRLLCLIVVIHVSTDIYHRQFSSHDQLYEHCPNAVHFTTLFLRFIQGIDSV